MNVCIPIIDDQGLESHVSAHFGSAPAFLIVDTDTGACRTVPNGNAVHTPGRCSPLQSLAGEALDAVVVGGIGMGALNQLLARQIPVCLAQHATVGETIAAWKAGALPPVQPGTACAHHGHGPGHHH